MPAEMSHSPDRVAALPVLITMPVSHFVEKARWALQRCGVAFEEEPHAVGFHRPAVKQAGGRGAVPCLRLPGDSGCVDGSDAILRWADSQWEMQSGAQSSLQHPLFPSEPEAAAEVDWLCKLFDEELGPGVRRFAYSHLLYTKEVASALVPESSPWHERLVMRCGGLLAVRPVMAKGLGISEEGGRQALKKVEQIFEQVGALLADGRPFLVAQRFTAADLAFAALSAPALGQPYAVAPGLSSGTPPAMREQVEALRATPAGQFALRLWETERSKVLV